MTRKKSDDLKHVERARKKQTARLSKKLEFASLLRTVASLFPYDLLTKLPPDSVGKSSNDYGKREYSLNFIEKKLCVDGKKLGSVTVGCYEMEHVSKKHSRLITEATGRCMDYWNAMCLAMRGVLSKDFAVYSDILLSRMLRININVDLLEININLDLLIVVVRTASRGLRRFQLRE
jgi:hypothetical protein